MRCNSVFTEITESSFVSELSSFKIVVKSKNLASKRFRDVKSLFVFAKVTSVGEEDLWGSNLWWSISLRVKKDKISRFRRSLFSKIKSKFSDISSTFRVNHHVVTISRGEISKVSKNFVCKLAVFKIRSFSLDKLSLFHNNHDKFVVWGPSES